MSELDPGTRDQVVQRLAVAGLRGPAVNVDAVAADLVARLDMDRSLDALIGPGECGRDGEER